MGNNKVINVDTKEVSCFGDSYSKHPLVYLKIARNKDKIICPYCSKTFLYKNNKFVK